jgi:hypothetical protein
VDQVNNAGSQGPWLSLNTDHPPPELWPRSNNPNYFSKINSWPLISKRMIDRLLPHLMLPVWTETGRRHGRWRETSNSRYKAPNTMWFLPTRSRRRGGPFCILMLVKTDGGRRATAVRFGRPLVAVTGSSDGPLVTRTGWTDSSRSPPAPPCFNFSWRRRIELSRQEILVR